MTMLVVCQRCAREYAPSRQDVVQGRWRTCPWCRDGPTPANTIPNTPEPNDETEQ